MFAVGDVVEVKGKKALSYVERFLPSDVLDVRRLAMTRRRLEDALKSRLKALLLGVLDSSGNIDIIPFPEIGNLEKFVDILDVLPERDVKALIYNVPIDVLDELVKFTGDRKPEVSLKFQKLMRKFRKSRWQPNPEVW